LPKKEPEISMKLRNLMEVPAITVLGETTIDDTAKLMWEKNVGSVIVVDQTNKMQGIVTERDVVFSVSKSMTGRQIPVSSIMSKTVLSAGPNESITTAVERMRKAGVRHLPVVDKSARAMGMISMRDALELSGPLLKILLSSTRKKRTPVKKRKTKR
jgi:CBS domain-containing protein